MGKVSSKEINEKIDELREILNALMSRDYRKNYERILEVSVQLDYLISECYKLKNK